MSGVKKATKSKTTKSKSASANKRKPKFVRAANPQKMSNQKKIMDIVGIVRDDRRLTLREIATKAETTEDDILRILIESGEYRHLHGQWVPTLQQPLEKYRRMDVCKQLLTQLKRDRIAFLRRFITVDQFWVYHKYPKPTEQSTSDAPQPKKIKTTSQTHTTDTSVKKVRVIVFWDAMGVILLDYPKKNQKITPEYYAKLLKQLSEEIKKKRPKLGKKTDLLQQNDTHIEESVIVGATCYRLNFEPVPHSQCWPDLAPTSYHLIPNLEKAFFGRRFSSNKAVIDAVNTYFENLDELTFKDGICELEQRWNKCIQAHGDFFE